MAAPTVDLRRLLNAEEVAELLNVSRRQVFRWASEGRLRAVRLGDRCIRFSPDAVVEFVEGRSE